MNKLSLQSRNTVREVFFFLIVGLIQYTIDISLFSLLVLTTGLTVLSNILSRAAGAFFGYYLNGVITFRVLGKIREKFAFRYVIAWMVMTVISILLIRFFIKLGHITGQSLVLVVVKASVELLLFIVSFLLHKLWIFAPKKLLASLSLGFDFYQQPALFLLAHAGDEVFFAPVIKSVIESNRPVYLIYMTDSSGNKSDPEVRMKESICALEQLGVPKEHLYFPGVMLNVRDGEGYMHLEKLYEIAVAIAQKLLPTKLYVPAWEGGHPDHDASHLVGVALAKHLCIQYVYECSCYHSYTRILPFRVMNLIPRIVPSSQHRLTLAEGLFFLSLIRFYPSQWRTWIGLAPEIFFHLVLIRHHEYRLVTKIDYLNPPHPGRLLYEKRFGVSWEKFHIASREFISHHLIPGEHNNFISEV